MILINLSILFLDLFYINRGKHDSSGEYDPRGGI